MGTRGRSLIAVLASSMAIIGGGCSARVSYPETRLQRVILPGLGELKEQDIRGEFGKTIEATSPASAGVAWLSEAPGDLASAWTQTPVNEYQRTGILNAVVEELRQPPFSSVTALPTVPNGPWDDQPSDTTLVVRSAAARFQQDVAVLMQTGVSQDQGMNVFALGFLGLVTIPFFPGIDLATGASAELCAIDVRTGVMIACTRGRAAAENRFLFPLQTRRVRDEDKERTLREAAESAATDLRAAVAARLANP